jgi:hypothetical protein
MGVKFAINPDAHSTDGYADIRYGIGAALQGLADAARCGEYAGRGGSLGSVPGAGVDAGRAMTPAREARLSRHACPTLPRG